jgi:ankyrin repeat protein
LSLFAGITLAAATGAVGKKPKEGGERLSPNQMQPKLLNAGTNPTLRYPVMRFPGQSSYADESYGWLDISKGRIRYTVMEPLKKQAEGFDLALSEIQNLEMVSEGSWKPYVHFSEGMRKKSARVAMSLMGQPHENAIGEAFIYVPQDRWGTVGRGVGHACQDGEAGTKSLLEAIQSFDSLLTMLLTEPVRNGDLAKVEALLKDNPDLALSRDNFGMTPLHWAAAGGHRNTVELLLANRADVNAQDNAGETPLHLAAKGHKDVAELLLANRANVNAQDNAGETPLHLAAEDHFEDVAELLLAKQADVNVKNKRGETPLHLAAEHHYEDLAELLRQHGGEDKTTLETTFQDAAGAGDLAKVQALLKDHPTLVSGKDYNGETPLHYAARNGRKDVAQLLLASKADLNARDNSARTPLHYAASLGQKDVVKLLLTSQAEVNAKDNQGDTPLHAAAVKGQIDVVELLREHGGEPLSDFSGARSLDPGMPGLIDKIVLLPVVDARSDKTEKVDLENMRKDARKALEWKKYAVLEADSPPPGERWVMVITLTELGAAPGHQPVASVFGSLYDKQSEVVRWQARGGGRYQSAASQIQPTGNPNRLLVETDSAVATDTTFILLGKAKKWALTNAVDNLLGGIPNLPTEKKK